MTYQQISESSQVYQNAQFGLYCQQTNTFYAFESFEQYKTFLQYLQAEKSSETSSNQQDLTSDHISNINGSKDEEISLNSSNGSSQQQNLSKIFGFQRQKNQMEDNQTK